MWPKGVCTRLFGQTAQGVRSMSAVRWQVVIGVHWLAVGAEVQARVADAELEVKEKVDLPA